MSGVSWVDYYRRKGNPEPSEEIENNYLDKTSI